MVKIDILIDEGKISRIPELELERYLGFFQASHSENLEHAKAVLLNFPRWSIISGYYAMHDMAKLFLARQFRLKIDYEVHSTAIKALREVLKDKKLLMMMDQAYSEFISLANDLAEAKKERTKAQYYTGTAFLKEQFARRAQEFLEGTVLPYLEKMRQLTESDAK